MYSFNCCPLAIVGLLLLQSCSSGPRSYPYLLEEERRYEESKRPIDVNGDGRDEFFQINKENAEKGFESIVFYTHEMFSINQLNVEGEMVTNSPWQVDITGDGRSELVICVLRNDSLFLNQLEISIARKEIEIAHEYFIRTGEAVTRHGVTYPWDPQISHIENVRARAESEPALLIVYSTRYTGYPRGLAMHALPGLQLVDSMFVGARVVYGEPIADLSKNGSLDALLTSSAVNNEVTYGGYSDDKTYLFLVDLSTMEPIIDTQMGMDGEATHTVVGNFLGDAGLEIIGTSIRNPDDHRIWVFDASTGKQLDIFSHAASVERFVRIEDPDSEYDALGILDVRKELHMISKGLTQQVRTNTFSMINTIFEGIDFNGDGDLNVYVFSGEGFFVLDQALKPLAMLPLGVSSGHIGLVKSGVTMPPLLRVETSSGLTFMFKVTKNPWFWIFRYGAPLASLGGALLFVGFTVQSRRLYRMQRHYDSLEHEKQLSVAAAKKKDQAWTEQVHQLEKDKKSLQEELMAVVLPGNSKPMSLLVKEVLDGHACDAEFNITKFADRLGYSKRHLSRIPQKYFGVLPDNLKWEYRVALAQKLLENTQLSLTEIAERTGFKNQAHFSTKFQELQGVTPSSVRQ